MRLIYKSTWTLRLLLIWVVSLGHFPEREKEICKGQKGYSVFFSDNTALTLIVIDIGAQKEYKGGENKKDENCLDIV